MLDGIDEIPWGDYEHAYGPAEDVPQLLRDLADSDADVRDDAEYSLYGNLWHQGTVYEATQYAVPFLIELLGHEQADRDWILVYLAHLGNGNSYHDVHQHMSFYEEQRADEEFQEMVAKELSWVVSAYEAVVKGIPTYLALLDDPDPGVRACCCYLFAVMRHQSEEIQSAVLKRAIEDEDNIVRAAAYFGSMYLTDVDVLLPIVEKNFGTEVDLLVKWTMAQVWALGAGPETPSKAVDVLLDALENNEELETQFQSSPWYEQDVIATTSYALQGLPPEMAKQTISKLAVLIEEVKGYSALGVAESILALAFGGPAPEDIKFEDLNEVQQEALKALAYSSKAWTFNVNMAEIMRWFKLPDWPDKLQEFCGLEKKSFDDSFVARGPGGHTVTATFELEEE